HANSSDATFDMSKTTKLTITGGTIIFHKQNATSFNDIDILNGSSKSITGGTFQMGSGSTPSGTTFKIYSEIPLFNLTINGFNTPSVQLTGDNLTKLANLTITNQLTMNGGNIDGATNGKKVILTNPDINSISRTSGFITGQMQRAIGNLGGTAYLFPVGNGPNYTPLILNFTGANNGGNITVSSNAGDHASLGTSLLNSSKSVNNYWTIENNGVTFSGMGGDFTFPSGIAEAGTYKVGIYDGSTWTYPTVTTATATSVGFSGVSSLGGTASFALAECIPPTITLGANPIVCQGITSTTLAYTATTNPPTEYRIDYDGAAETAGFSDVSFTLLPSSQITLALPATLVPGTYNATLYVRNASDCESSAVEFTITVNPSTGATSFTAGATTVCQDAVDETYTATAANSTSIAYSVS
ncbi:MAG: hypothetical protein Q7I98_03430, partial [Erysipelotrichaceae bacterium]|nr:hypothetical protein [Erysipelotrichaceae bacterium]